MLSRIEAPISLSKAWTKVLGIQMRSALPWILLCVRHGPIQRYLALNPTHVSDNCRKETRLQRRCSIEMRRHHEENKPCPHRLGRRSLSALPFVQPDLHLLEWRSVLL